MKNKTSATLLFGVSFIVYLTIGACKKDDKPTNPVVGKWKMIAYIHDGMDVYGTEAVSCVIDNIITFTSDGKIIGDQGPKKCDPTEPQIVKGTYSLTNDNSQLTTVVNGYTGVDSILTLNSTTLKYEQNDNGDIVTYTRVQ